jgi:antitoxin PrlF
MNEQITATRMAEQLVGRPGGATMDEIIAATGAPQYNVLRRLGARGYRIRKVKEGRTTRYFAEAPRAESFRATMTSKGQVTIPQAIRDRLRLRRGQDVQFTIEEGNRVVVTPVFKRLADLVGILPRPKRKVTIEEMNDAVRKAAADRYFRAIGRRQR